MVKWDLSLPEQIEKSSHLVLTRLSLHRHRERKTPLTEQMNNETILEDVSSMHINHGGQLWQEMQRQEAHEFPSALFFYLSISLSLQNQISGQLEILQLPEAKILCWDGKSGDGFGKILQPVWKIETIWTKNALIFWQFGGYLVWPSVIQNRKYFMNHIQQREQ